MNQVINPDTKEISSFLITARAGCGKSHLIKQIQAKLDENKIDYVSLGPTNKSCIQIKGETIHKFTNRISNNIKSFESKVIIIDEISMMMERFYKFFSTLKRMKPDVKFIMVGDYNQLKPVNDRVSEGTDYEGSPVVYELCDGNHIQLSKHEAPRPFPKAVVNSMRVYNSLMLYPCREESKAQLYASQFVMRQKLQTDRYCRFFHDVGKSESL